MYCHEMFERWIPPYFRQYQAFYAKICVCQVTSNLEIDAGVNTHLIRGWISSSIDNIDGHQKLNTNLWNLFQKAKENRDVQYLRPEHA